MGTDISGIAKNMLQVRSNLKTETIAKDSRQDFTASFMEFMNQGSMPNMNLSADSSQITVQADTKNAANTAYDTSSAAVKSVSVKSEAAPEELQSEAADALDTYEEEIREILKNELGVTDEEISAAMENLGMSILDARNLQDLTAIVQELTGEDIGTLFSSDAFQNVMEQVAVATETLCAELGVTNEEFQMLCEAWEQMQPVEAPEMEAAVNGGSVEEDLVISVEENKFAEVEMPNEVQPKEQEAVAVQKDETASKGKISFDENAEEMKVSDQKAYDAQKETGDSSKEQGSLDHSKDARSDVLHTETAFVGQQTATSEEFILPQEAPQPYAGQVDAFDLIEQIAKNVRVTISGTETSMEMQLNPENLGKIYLNVSEREGIVRAQIAAQNETVKEALESQLVELRQSLHQQGIKVDAIEVTVAAHEFEQNLEENARQEEQMQQQMERNQKQPRKNLNLNDLDGLSGLMTEEEVLAAQIMRDNGNQVDLTA